MRKGTNPKSFNLSWSNISGDVRVDRFKESLNILKSHPTAPEEASWFYVHDITFQNITERDHANHNEILKGSLLSNLVYSTPNGLSSVPVEEKFTTVVDNKEIIRNKLGLYIRPLSDRWQKTFPSKYFGGYFDSYSQFSIRFLLDFLPLGHGMDEFNVLDIGTGGYKAPYGPEVEISLVDYPFKFGRDLDLSRASRGLQTTLSDSTTYNYGAGFRIPFKEDRGINLLRNINPPHNNYSAGREEEEYQKTNGDYTKKLIDNQQVNTIMDIAKGLINPIYSVGMLFRIINNIGEAYLSYKNEEARQADALLNYFGNEFHSVRIKKHFATGTQYISNTMKTGETLSLSIPTKKVYITENNEKVFNKSLNNVTIPVNKLFKSYEEFEQDLNLEQYIPWFKREPEAIKGIRITPYMVNGIMELILYKENQYITDEIWM